MTSDLTEDHAKQPRDTWVWQGDDFSCLPGIFRPAADPNDILATASPKSLTELDDIKAPSSVPGDLEFSTIRDASVMIGRDPQTGRRHFFTKSKTPAPLRAQIPADMTRFRR